MLGGNSWGILDEPEELRGATDDDAEERKKRRIRNALRREAQEAEWLQERAELAKSALTADTREPEVSATATADVAGTVAPMLARKPETDIRQSGKSISTLIRQTVIADESIEDDEAAAMAMAALILMD